MRGLPAASAYARASYKARWTGGAPDASLTPAGICVEPLWGMPENTLKMPTPAEMKRALIQAGFEVYTTRGDVVHLADRVRENLIMDAGIFIKSGVPAVGFVVRAQKNDFPNEGEE